MNMHQHWAGSIFVLHGRGRSKLFLTGLALMGATTSGLIGPAALARAAVGEGATITAHSLLLAQTAEPEPEPISDRISRPTLRLGSQGEAVSELQAILKLLGFYPGAVNGQFQEPTQTAVKQFQSAAGLNPDGIVGSATWSQLLPTPPSEANPPTATGSGAAPAPTAAASPQPVAPTNPQPAAAASPQQPAAPASSPAAAQPSRPGGSTGSAAALPVLRPGMRGDAVVRLQERLRALGLYRGAIDGVFGAQTEQAVKQAQQQYRLEPDGIVGPATWDALL